MKDSKSILAAVAFAAAVVQSQGGQSSWGVRGTVDEESVVAVDAAPALYAAATPGRADALACELRVRDSSGNDVPYTISRRMVRTHRPNPTWRQLRIVSARDEDGRLIVEAEFPSVPQRPTRFLALKVSTPLRDFVQNVEVSAYGEVLATGTLSDYSRFANVRESVITLDTAFRQRLCLTFSKPTSAARSAAFQRTVRECGDGSPVETTVRRTVVERPFRIDSVSVQVPDYIEQNDPAPPLSVPVACSVETNSAKKIMCMEFPTMGLPVAMVHVNGLPGNYCRKATVLKRADGRWKPVGSGQIKMIRLDGYRHSNLDVQLNETVWATALRVEIENVDGQEVPLERNPVSIATPPHDIVFLAKPGERYSVSVERGAERPQYDLTVINYARGTVETKRLELDIEPLKEISGSAEVLGLSEWLKANVVAIASVFTFIALAAVCLFLFRANGDGSRA